MTVRQVYVAEDLFEVSGAGFEPHGKFTRDGAVVEPPEPLQLLLRAAALTSDARLARSDGRWQIKGDPTEGALVVLAAKAGFKKIDLEAQFPRVHEVPFSSEAKRMTTLHRSPSGLIAYAKGAPEIILDSCAYWLASRGEEKLEKSRRESLLQTAREMASHALRVLAVAYKPNATPEDCEHEMVFLGLVGMIDPPRPEVQAAIRRCEQAGIKPVMITGDHPLTATAVARELDLLNTGQVITGCQSGHGRFTRVGFGSGPARGRSHAPSAEESAYRYLHSARDYFDGCWRIVVDDSESGAFPLASFVGPRPP